SASAISGCARRHQPHQGLPNSSTVGPASASTSLRLGSSCEYSAATVINPESGKKRTALLTRRDGEPRTERDEERAGEPLQERNRRRVRAQPTGGTAREYCHQTVHHRALPVEKEAEQHDPRTRRLGPWIDELI